MRYGIGLSINKLEVVNHNRLDDAMAGLALSG